MVPGLVAAGCRVDRVGAVEVEMKAPLDLKVHKGITISLAGVHRSLPMDELNQAHRHRLLVEEVDETVVLD